MEDITEVLWGSKESPFTINELNKKGLCGRHLHAPQLGRRI